MTRTFIRLDYPFYSCYNYSRKDGKGYETDRRPTYFYR